MGRNLALADQNQANPLFYVCMAFLLMGFLFGISMILAGGSEAEEPAAPNAPGGGGGGGFVSLFPNAPISTNSPVPDGPAVTIVQDIRETMHRLPDRNKPKGWPDPAKKKKTGG